MIAQVYLANLRSEQYKHRIIREINRIKDVRVLELDMNTQILLFQYNTTLAYKKVEKELWRLGYPMVDTTTKVASEKRTPASQAKRLLEI
jgi:hypothetical protein